MTQAITVAHAPAPLAMPAAAPLALSQEQEQLIRDMYGNGASNTEFAVFLEVCRARRLNPLTRQIHFVSRWDNEKGKNVWSAQVSIDGLRAIAERTGKYDGQDEPEFEYDDKRRLVLARVKVYRKDWTRPAVGVARFDEYAGKKRDGGLTHMWASKGHVMIAKCAEALALRKAFPEDLSGLYVSEEMGETEKPRGRSVAHAIVGDDVDSPCPALMRQLERIEADVAKADSYDAVLKLRAELGSKAKRSQLTSEIQVAVESNSINGDEYKALSKLWGRCHRQLEKKEKEIPAPSAEASFRDPEPGDYDTELVDEPEGREPGED